MVSFDLKSYVGGYKRLILHKDEVVVRTRSDQQDESSTRDSNPTAVILLETQSLTEEPFSSSIDITEATTPNQAATTRREVFHRPRNQEGVLRRRAMDTEERIGIPSGITSQLSAPTTVIAENPSRVLPEAADVDIYSLEDAMYRSKLFSLWMVGVTSQVFFWLSYSAIQYTTIYV